MFDLAVGILAQLHPYPVHGMQKSEPKSASNLFLAIFRASSPEVIKPNFNDNCKNSSPLVG